MDSIQIILIIGIAALALVNIIGLLYIKNSINSRIERRQLTTSKKYNVRVDESQVLDEMDMGAVEEETKKQLLDVAKESAERLQKNLDNTVDQISISITDMASTQLTGEFEKYQVSLQALRDQTITEFNKIQQELDKRKGQLLEHMDNEVAKERAKIVDNFNSRINDVVASYLAECLGNQVDLGSQANYIFSCLEAHKNDIKKDILS
ncbi:MAG: hypothetical protein PVI21_02360 [Candidatus Woesebacteria bacterium]|jgi:hypothetical protein